MSSESWEAFVSKNFGFFQISESWRLLNSRLLKFAEFKKLLNFENLLNSRSLESSVYLLNLDVFWLLWIFWILNSLEFFQIRKAFWIPTSSCIYSNPLTFLIFEIFHFPIIMGVLYLLTNPTSFHSSPPPVFLYFLRFRLRNCQSWKEGLL